MKKELDYFFTALMFYTRIPYPKWVKYSEENLNKATRYFPLIGWIVGGIATLVLYLSFLILPVSISIILSMVAGILTTGSFHEDGFTDTCDGFGGGWTKQKILDIMKDSRIGAYGAVGLFFILMTKFLSLQQLMHVDIIFVCKVIIAAHAFSRLSAIMVRVSLDYVRESEDAKSKPLAKHSSFSDYVLVVVFGILPLFLFKSYMIFLVAVPVGIAMYFLRGYFVKWIGGYTGDCLGAAQQVSEIVFYLSVIALWRFI